MMRGDKEMSQIALRVSIALAAGMFSIVPVAYGAPVGGQVVKGGASIEYTGKDTKINSGTMNNVIDWQDFSVAKDEHVYFDGSTETGNTVKTHNYMNIVTGANTSQIDGMIKGGKEVYIINPNGVIFGEKASVDVGSLYASTRYVSDTVKNAVDPAGTTMESIINTGSAGVAADVVNMGTINANKVVMEGQNVRFVNDNTLTNNGITGVTANNVILKADTDTGDPGYVHVGNNTGTSNSYKTVSIRQDVSTDNLTALPDINYYKLIDGSNWHTTIATNSSGNFMLRKDIVAGADTHDDGTGTQVANFAPITGTFTGNFDGNYHTISNMTAEQGLFEKTSGNNRIENVGVVNSTIENSNRDYAGAIAGEATGTIFRNVFNEGSSVKVTYMGQDASTARSGGLIGRSYGATLKESYNNGTFAGNGLIAYADKKDTYVETTIKDSYSIGEVTSMGFISNASSNATVNIGNCYAKSAAGATGGTEARVKIKNSVVYGLEGGNRAYGSSTGAHTQPYDNDLTYKDSYTNSAVGWTSITNTGGVNEPDANDAVTRSTWRIYEGQDMPVLTSFLKGIKTVNYNYGYFDDNGLNTSASVYGGSNGIGSNTQSTYTDAAGNTIKKADDIPAYSTTHTDGLIYNGKTLKILDLSGTEPAAATDSSSIQFAQQSISDEALSHVKYDANGRKDSTFDGSTVNTWAMIHSDQQGYDLVGGNIAISPRSVTTNTTASSYTIAREYNGSADASDAVVDVFTGANTTTSGFLPEDEASMKVRYSGTASFQSYTNGQWVDDKNVGINKKVNINGSLSLASVTTDDNGTTTVSDYTGHNYALVNDAGEYVTSVALPSGNITGAIYQKELVVKAAKDDYAKPYDKGSEVRIKNGEGENVTYDIRTIAASDFDFDTSGIVTHESTTNPEGQEAEQVELAYDTIAHYVASADDEALEVTNAGTHAVRLSGVKLTGADRDNYVLVYEDSAGNRTNIYSAKGLISQNNSGGYEQEAAINPEASNGAGGGGNVYSTGVINRRNISSTGFEWYTGDESNKTWHNGSAAAGAATREYTGYETYELPNGAKVSNERNSTEGSGLLAGDSLTFTVQSAVFAASDAWSDTNGDHSYTPTKNVHTDTQVGAQGVVYTVSISDNGTGAAANYTLDGQDISTTNTVIGAGAITPRTLNVMVNSAANAIKIYDGDAKVKATNSAGQPILDDEGNAKTSFGLEDGYLSYTDPSEADSAHHLLTSIDDSKITITGLYRQTGLDGAAENVNYTQSTTTDPNTNTTTTTYTIADKNITYTAAVYEGDSTTPSQNYKFSTSGESTAEFEGTGRIIPATITAVTFADVEKTYDGSEKVTNKDTSATYEVGEPLYAKDRITIASVTGAVNNEAVDKIFAVDENGRLALNSEVLTGKYGKMGDNGFEADENVARDETPDHNVIAKTVKYEGLGNLLKTRNYVLTGNLGDEAYGTGTIKALKITNGDWIHLDRNDDIPITKIYNGNTDVATVADAAGNVPRSAADYLTARQAYIQTDSGSDALDISLNVVGADYASQHQGTWDVNYKLSVTETGNYTIDRESDLLNFDSDGNLIKTLSNAGTITPRPITIIDNAGAANDDIANHNITKVYDGNSTISLTGESLIKIADQLVSDVDPSYSVSNGIIAGYNDKNAGTKTVTYTLKVDGDTNGDYYFRSETSDIHCTTWSGNGTIEKRVLNIETTAAPEKTYGEYDDGLTGDMATKLASVKSSTMPTMGDSDQGIERNINFGSTENNAVVIADGFDSSQLTGLYGSGNSDDDFEANGDVRRVNGIVSDKDVQYSGVLAALGGNAGNYEVANTFYGTGRIKPKTIDHTAFKFYISDNITQTYSGSEAVGEYGMVDTESDKVRDNFRRSWVNTAASGVDLNGNGTVDVSLANGAYEYSIIRAEFDSADAGTGNKTVTYEIHVDPVAINNFVYDDDNVSINDINLTDSSNTGTILQRTIIASVANDSPLSKYYDGTTDVYNGDNVAYSGATGSGSKLTGADVVAFEAVVADGTTTQTGLVAGSNASIGEYVGAGVGIGNKTINYTAKVDDAHSANYKFVDKDGNALVNGQGTALTTEGNTIKPFGVVVTAADTTKVYDGTKNVTADKSTAALQLEANYDNLTTPTGITAATGKYDDPNVNGGAAHTVTYTGFTLNNDNYYLAKADGSAIDTNADGENVITGKGYIEKYMLTALPEFVIHDVTKEYDTDPQVKYNRSTDKDLLKEHFVTAQNVPSALAFDLVSAEYTDAVRGEDKHVDFTIKISGDNYNFSTLIANGLVAEGTNSIQHTYTAENAVITPRKVYVALKGNTEISKVYDGNTDLEAADLAAVRTVNQEVYIPNTADILAGDQNSVHIDWAGIGAEYADKDVGDVAVKYTISLTNNDAGNYELYRYSDGVAIDNNDDDKKLTGTGKITPAALTIDAVDKFYDGNSNVTTPIKLIGVNNEETTLTTGAMALVNGRYGDANVSWNGDTVADKDITYEGLTNAVQYMITHNEDGGMLKNYTIADTVYFTAAQSKGKIKPIAITNAAVENWTPITREYNADTDLEAVYERGGTSGNTLALKDILKLTLTVGSGGSVTAVTDSEGRALTVNYEAEGSYANDGNVGDNKTLNFLIKTVDWQVADNAGNKNYVLSDTVLNNLQGAQLTSGSDNQITARQLSGSLTNPMGNRKIYDGSRNADASNFVIDEDDRDVLLKDGLLNDVTVTALYNTKEACADPGEVTDGKTIDYTLALNDTSGNYVIAATPAAVARGDIERRKVYVDGTNVTGVDKDYDGDTALPAGIDYNAMGFGLRVRDDSSKTGLVDGEEAITLDSSNISGSYTSPNVNRAADGSVIAREITFTGFALDDSNAASGISKDNYKLIDANGSGVIRPLPISVTIAEAPIKTYDGTTTVKGTAAANANLVPDPDALLPNESVNIIIKAANYDNANAGTNKGYTYSIELPSDSNYTLVQGTDAPRIAVTGNGLKGRITADDGIIEKRVLTPTVINTMTKEYDGTTAGTQNAAANVSLRNVVNGDNVGLTVRAVYDNPNAGISEGSDELQNHVVTYTLNLSNPNYELAENTVAGTGKISRKGLTIVATPVSVNTGEAMPKFTGTVSGFLPGELGLASSFTFGTLPTVSTSQVDSYPVYGWYRNQTAGNYGLNYTFDQDVDNATAFTVTASSIVNDNPDTKITPRGDIYRQISKDMNSGFGDMGAAAIEYVDKSGKVIARENIDSGEIHGSGVESGTSVTELGKDDKALAHIGIVGGDIVNLEGADAASTANVEVNGDGSIVNLQVFSVESEEKTGGSDSAMEIRSIDGENRSNSSIQIVDEKGRILEEETEDKTRKQNKKGEIAIESSNNQDDDEIELKVEKEGVNVA